MFSIVERATTRAFARILVIVLAAALLCGALSVETLAVKTEKTPYEYPGDGEGTGGYKGFEFENPPSSTANQRIDRSEGYAAHRLWRLASSHRGLGYQFYLIVRK